MSATVNPFPMNQTTSVIETSTSLDNVIYRNYSSTIEASTYLDNVTYINYTSTIETSTYLDNNTYRNYSSNADNPQPWTNVAIYKYSYFSVMLFIIIFGIIGNFLMIIMMGDPKLKSLSYPIYLKCLAVSDSLVLIINLVNQIQELFSLGRVAPDYVCPIMFSIKYVVGIVSPWLVVGLTFDRYVCVCFPLKREMFCTKKKAVITCASLFIASLLLISPFPAETEVIRGRCTPTDAIKSYSIFLLLSVPSILPCFFILFLNILLIIQIQRSQRFRETFVRSTNDRTRGQQDRSTRPLVFASVLAFITLMPLAISQLASFILSLTKKDSGATNINIRTVLYIIYLTNFGQNFYILIASSSNYRTIIKQRLFWIKK